MTVPGLATRPTTDRVRESVFAFLASRLAAAGGDPGQQLAGRQFLDLYAGSGAVGLEAASRGARVTWVDRAAGATRVIDANRAALGVPGNVARLEVRRFLAGPPAPFDIVWMDPPYEVGNDEVEHLVDRVAQGWVVAGGLVLVERAWRTTAIEFPESFLNVGRRRCGDTAIHYAEKVGS